MNPRTPPFREKSPQSAAQREAPAGLGAALLVLGALLLGSGCNRQDDTPVKPAGSSLASPYKSTLPPGHPPIPEGWGKDNGGGDFVAGPRVQAISSFGSPADLRSDFGATLIRVADRGSGGSLSHADKSFIKDAAAGGLFEVQVGKVASERARDPAVKSFAEKLVADHSAANEELKQLAGSRNVEIPDELPMMKRRTVDNLRKTSADKFDREFIEKVGMKDHDKDIKEFEKAARDVKDPELRAWAEKTLPTLRQHRGEAQRLAANNLGKADKGASGGSQSGRSNAARDSATTGGQTGTGGMGTGSTGSAGAGGTGSTGSSGGSGGGGR